MHLSPYCNILPVTLTRSIFCGETFQPTQWHQYFSDEVGGGGIPVADGRWSVVSREVRSCIVVIKVSLITRKARTGGSSGFSRDATRLWGSDWAAEGMPLRKCRPYRAREDFNRRLPRTKACPEGSRRVQGCRLFRSFGTETHRALLFWSRTPVMKVTFSPICLGIQCLRAYSVRSTA
jgi:hypothetical protein